MDLALVFVFIHPAEPPCKEVLALEYDFCKLMVKRSGAPTANPNERTELVQFLVQRLRDFHDGKDLIPNRPLSRQEKSQGLGGCQCACGQLELLLFELPSRKWRRW